MSEQVSIDRRFRGPPESGHGGYVCGVVAELIGSTAEVTLRRPPPLDRTLSVERLDGGGVVLRDAETVIAEGAPTSLEIEVPEPVTLTDAENAATAYRGFRHQAFPTCFACGPRRAEGDGLRIFPGLVRGRKVVAAPWTPDASLADQDGTVQPQFLWAALDCPGAWAWAPAPGLSSLLQGVLRLIPALRRPVVLGRLAAKPIAPVHAGEPHVVIGWALGAEGRRRFSGTALFSANGGLRAIARSTWIRLSRPPRPG